ncbi:hypothetical protein [Streptomyces phaeochromogenes]
MTPKPEGQRRCDECGGPIDRYGEPPKWADKGLCRMCAYDREDKKKQGK